MSISLLPWEHDDWSRFKVVRFDTIGDGSCFFHAFLAAFYLPYRDAKDKEKREIVRSFRRELSKELYSTDAKGVSNYDKLGEGNLRAFGNAVREYSLDGMCKRLDSYQYVGHEFNEFLERLFHKDIYIIDYSTRDPYIIPMTDKQEPIYRNSIVILYMPGHYELMGINIGAGRIATHFAPDHEFICFLRERTRRIIAQRRK